MESTTPANLLATLRRPALRVRTGLWLMPLEQLGHEEDEAARLGIDAVDLRLPLLADLPEDTAYLGLDVVRTGDLLDNLCAGSSGTDCLLVFNLDLIISRLRYDERNELWRFLYQGFAHRDRALLLTMPATATHLLPSSDLCQAWRRDGRLIGESL